MCAGISDAQRAIYLSLASAQSWTLGPASLAEVIEVILYVIVPHLDSLLEVPQHGPSDYIYLRQRGGLWVLGGGRP